MLIYWLFTEILSAMGALKLNFIEHSLKCTICSFCLIDVIFFNAHGTCVLPFSRTVAAKEIAAMFACHNCTNKHVTKFASEVLKQLFVNCILFSDCNFLSVKSADFLFVLEEPEFYELFNSFVFTLHALFLLIIIF